MTTDVQRFMSKVKVTPECWEWTGYRNTATGYPQLHRRPRVLYAYRYSYELFVGPIPEGLEIDHLCSNPGCVRPDHLEPVDRVENLARSSHPVSTALRTNHCIHGHALTPDNVRVRKNGSRVCKTCALRRNRAYRTRSAA